MPDDGGLVDLIPRIATTSDLRRRLLVDNPPACTCNPPGIVITLSNGGPGVRLSQPTPPAPMPCVSVESGRRSYSQYMQAVTNL
jgi:hypothetical protein